MEAVAVILARAGSKGLPGKNLRPLRGRPLVAWAIDDARAARAVDRVILSTDGDAIAAAGKAAGAEIVRRPPELATDRAAVADAVRDAVRAAAATEPIVLVLYACVPVRPAGLVDRAIDALLATGADSVQSYADVGKHHPHWMVRLDEAGRVEPLRAGHADRRQDLPPLFLPDGGAIAVTRAALLGSEGGDAHAFLGADRRGIVNPPGAVIDVDRADDLRRAEAALDERGTEPVGCRPEIERC